VSAISSVPQKLTFGLDIGIASVGWAVLAENRIVDLGVRCFDKAETADRGESLNLARRSARLTRRRLYRRAWRLTKLARLLKREGLIPSADFFKSQPGFQDHAWQLRVAGLDRLLTPTEWARVIYHLCKHRGFHWISKAEEVQAEADAKGEGGRVKQGLSQTESLMKEKAYRTAAEMVLKEYVKTQTDSQGIPKKDKVGQPIPVGAARNKRGDYSQALSRKLLDEELGKLFEAQRRLGNLHANVELEIIIRGTGDKRSGLFWKQKPALSGNDLLKMLGRCTFERTGGPDGKGEYRAPKASFLAERHVWLTRLNNLRIIASGVSRPLNEAERQIVLPLPYGYADAKLTYKQMRSALTKKTGLHDFNFVGIPNDKEKDVLVKLPSWEKLSSTLKDKGLESEWLQISTAALEGKPAQLDAIGWVLSVFKDDDEIRTELDKLKLPGGQRMNEALLSVSFDKFHALSLKALRRIVPQMETGLRYDEACEIAGYVHSRSMKVETDDKEKFLPPLYEDARGHKPGEVGKLLFSERVEREITGGIPRNPVVLRALNQARKVVNALIRKHGSPASVHIEMARDLSRPLKERKAISDAQDEFQKINEKARTEFETTFGLTAKGREFEKFMLYREQDGQCAYSLRPLAPSGDIRDIFAVGATEIDHALPYSRSFDNSKNNKVLVLPKENRDKGDKTPYEYLTSFEGGENGERWCKFVAAIERNHKYRGAKKNRLLRKNFGLDESMEFMARNLNDTRYICKFFKNYVEQYLQLTSDSKRCVVVNGGLTSLLRARWGLPTSKTKRAESDRHHAMDAVVIAACGHLIVQRTSTMLNSTGWTHRPDLGGYLNTETGEILSTQEFARKDDVYKLLPRPWKHFRDELLARINLDNLVELRSQMKAFSTYPTEALESLTPLFVSRAPQRRNGGAAHKETIYPKPRPDHRLMVQVKAKDGKKFSRTATPEELGNMAVEQIGVFETADKGRKYRLTEERLNDAVGAERNAWMIHALRLWIAQRGDNPKQPGTTVFPKKPRKGDPQDGPFTGPEIKSIKVNAGDMTGFEVREGIVQNERLVRLDVFQKDRRYFLVPLYIRHKVVRQLPVHTADGSVAVDDSYQFLFAIHPNDLIEVRNGEDTIRGYFKGYGGPPNPSNITLVIHDRNAQSHPRANTKGEIPSIGVRTANALIKFHVDILGNVYPAPPEVRHGLA
jgi:CRISPR-associated endonuclease Csn1